MGRLTGWNIDQLEDWWLIRGLTEWKIGDWLDDWLIGGLMIN